MVPSWRDLYRRIGLGHPLHATVVHFPVACLVLAWIAQGITRAWPSYIPPECYRVLLATGLLFALPALVTGVLEFWMLELKSSGETLALWHLGLMGTAVTLFFLSWLLERLDRAPFSVGFGLNGLGVITLVAGAWFGGELVHGHGVTQREHEQEGESNRRGL